MMWEILLPYLVTCCALFLLLFSDENCQRCAFDKIAPRVREMCQETKQAIGKIEQQSGVPSSDVGSAESRRRDDGEKQG